MDLSSSAWLGAFGLSSEHRRDLSSAPLLEGRRGRGRRRTEGWTASGKRAKGEVKRGQGRLGFLIFQKNTVLWKFVENSGKLQEI